MALVHINMYYSDHYGEPMLSASEYKPFLHLINLIICVTVTVFVLKWSTTKPYKTFMIIWNNKPPKNVFDKQFLHSAFLFSLSSTVIAYLFGFIIGDFCGLYFKIIFDLLVGAIFLFTFIKNNWFNFQLKKL